MANKLIKTKKDLQKILTWLNSKQKVYYSFIWKDWKVYNVISSYFSEHYLYEVFLNWKRFIAWGSKTKKELIDKLYQLMK